MYSDVKSLIAVDEPELVMPLFYSERSEFRARDDKFFLGVCVFSLSLSQLVFGVGRVLFRKNPCVAVTTISTPQLANVIAYSLLFVRCADNISAPNTIQANPRRNRLGYCAKQITHDEMQAHTITEMGMK